MDRRNTALFDLGDKLSSNVKFTVPIYQREYSWTHYECKTLFNDLLEFDDRLNEYESLNLKSDKNNKFRYFLGMVMIREKKVENDYTENMIVDGQQRITTIFIMLSAIKNWMEENQSDIKNNRLYDYLFDFCEKILFLMPNSEDILISKLNSIADSGLLKEMTTDTFHHKTSKSYNENKSSNISKNYDFFYNQIDSIDKIDSIINALNSTQILWVQLSEFEDENQIFESINFKGIKLTPSDLIKNLLFSNEDQKLMSTPENILQFNSISRTYNNIVSKFKLKNESELSETLDELYRYYVAYYGNYTLVKSGYEIYKIYKSNLYSKFNKNSISLDNIEMEIIDLLKFFGSYCEIKNIINSSDIDLKKMINDNYSVYNLKSIYSQSDSLYWLIIYALLEKLNLISTNKVKVPKSNEWLFDIKIDWQKHKNILNDSLKIIDGFDMYVAVMNNGSNKNLTRSLPLIAKNIRLYEGDIENIPNYLREQLINSTDKTKAAEKDINYSTLKLNLNDTRMYAVNRSITKRILLNMNNIRISDKDYFELDFKNKVKGIEHIIPRSVSNTNAEMINSNYDGNLSKNLFQWISDIRNRNDNLEQVKDKLDTLPNLVYISNKDNLDLSNKPFLEKRDIVNKNAISSVVYKNLINDIDEKWEENENIFKTFSLIEMNSRIDDYINFFKEYLIIK